MPSQTPHAPAPRGFTTHEFRTVFTSRHSLEEVWDFLNRPETFTKGQPPLYFVEFVSPEPDKPANFRPGVFNTHHGPGLHLPAVITTVEPQRIRNMNYLYGAFVLNFRLIRPTCLNFRFKPHGSGCKVELVLRSHVRPLFKPLWNLGLRVFWGAFGWGLDRDIRRALRS